MTLDFVGPLFLGGHELLPNLRLLISQLVESDSTLKSSKEAEAPFEPLPYCIGASCRAYLEYIELHNAVLQDVVADRDKSKVKIDMLGVGGCELLSFKLDSFLDAALRTQNAIVPYIRYRVTTYPFHQGKVKKTLDRFFV